jgi:large subunit ribosomal protein L38e
MPKEIFDEERFLNIAEQRAIHCRVKRKKDTVKLKLRTKKYLYTLKTDPSTAERLLNQVPCDVIELR